MASRVWLTAGYIIPRWSVWTLLLIVAIVDGLRHRQVRSRGWQLYAALVLSVFLFCTREAFLLAYAVLGGGWEWTRTASFGGFIFFSNVADSYFFWVLIAIAAGFCITRPDLGPHRTVSFVIPGIFFVTSLVVDYVMYGLRGREAFSDASDPTPICVGGDTQDPDYRCDPAQEVGAVTGLVFFICIIANMMAFMLAWFYIFETVQKERERLESGGEDGGVDAEGGNGVTGSGPSGVLPLSRPGQTAGGAAGTGTGAGHTAGLTGELYVDRPGQLPGEALYSGTREEDLDAPRTVQDRIETRDKIRLLRNFFYGVSAYVVATLAVLFLPIFAPAVLDRVILVIQNVLLLLLLAALLFAFRMRAGNSYLVLDESTGADTTTELGVLAPRGLPSDHPDHGKAAADPYAAAFTLDDDEDDEPVVRQPRRHTRSGIVLTTLPTTPQAQP